MKATIAALFAIFAVSSAGYLAPAAYSYGYGLGLSAPLAYSTHYNAPFAAPLAYAAAPIAVAPAVQSGYVAANRGAIHTAPLPEGPHAFSHHINTAPAPGTY